MKVFFASDTRQAKLLIEATRWIGTPFAPHAAIRGAGVDCVNLCAQLLKACGHADDFALPRYVMDGGKHNATSQLIEYLDSREDFSHPFAPAQCGDVLCFKLGRSSHHCGMMLHGKTFIHALYGRKVAFASLADKTFARALFAFYRPVEP